MASLVLYQFGSNLNNCVMHNQKLYHGLLLLYILGWHANMATQLAQPVIDWAPNAPHSPIFNHFLFAYNNVRFFFRREEYSN